MIPRQFHLVLVVSLVCEWFRTAAAHGRLWEPPSRSSMWRRGWDTPANYNDMELFCGGFDHQVSLGYKCGLCGDPYDGVRENESGGKYATGTITQTYTQGQNATLQVDLTAAHKGYFEFKVCARDHPDVHETQECFDLHLLPLADGSGSKYYPEESSMISINVTLPADLTCSFCVLQWRYHTGNSWGVGPEGGCIGCGPQEEFYGCADFQILPSNASEPSPASSPVGSANNQTSTPAPVINPSGPTPVTNPSGPTPFMNPTGPTPVTNPSGPTPVTNPSGPTAVTNPSGPTPVTNPSGPTPVTNTAGPTPRMPTNCEAKYRQTSLDSWCQETCQRGYCNKRHCTCPEAGQKTPRVCRPKSNSSQTTDRCTVNCVAGFCPYSNCDCF